MGWESSRGLIRGCGAAVLSLASVVLDVIRCRAIKLSLVGASAKLFPARQPHFIYKDFGVPANI